MTPQFKIVQVSAKGTIDSSGNQHPWVDTGLTVGINQRLTIVATGQIHLYNVEGTWAMPWVGPNGCASVGSGGQCSLFANWGGQTCTTAPPGQLIAQIGGATPFSVGKFRDKTVISTETTSSGKLSLAVNDLTTYYYDNRGGFTVLIAIDAPGVPIQDGECPFCQDAAAKSPNPVKLQTGDKTWSGTDLEVTTPAGSLSFTRSYTQSKQNHAQYQFMGLGWSHNHAYKLTLSGISPTRNAEVYLPEGGSIKLNESSANHFDAVVGSTSVLDYDATHTEYILTAQDKSQLAFDGTTLQLKRRSWSSGESWAYNYYVAADGADLDGKLNQIDDGYGRLLKFVYIRDTDPNPYQRRQLWRVGDQTAAATLSNTTPSGRYIELAYTPEKLNGSAVAGALALLSSVRDTRGNNYTWIYDYYGQTNGVGQTDPQQLNFLLKRLSPAVDTSGDGVADGSIALEEVGYTLESTALAINGDMESTTNWNAVGTPVFNVQSTVQFDSATHSRYLESNAIGQGFESDDWNLVPGRVYIITARVYPVAGRVKMQVKGTVLSDESQAGTSAWETLRLVYSPSGDAQVRRLQFVTSAMPGSGNAQVYVDSVSVSRLKNLQQKRGDAQLVTDFVFAQNDTNLTTETLAGKTANHYFANGAYVGPSNPAGELTGQTLDLNYRASNVSDAKGNVTQLDWSSTGKSLNGVTDPMGQDTAFSYDSSDRLLASVDAQGRKTVYGYDAANRQPAFILVDDNNNLAVNGSMEADTTWTNVGTPSRNQRTPAAQTGRYLRHLVASAAGQGMEGNTWDLEIGHTYTLTARVYVVSGAVKLQVTGTSAFDQVISIIGVWSPVQVVYTPTSGLTGNKLQFVANGAAAEFYVDSVSILKSGLELAVNGGMELDSDWASLSTPTTNERSNGRVDSGVYARHVVASAANQGIIGNNWTEITNQIYTITARVFPVSGIVKMQVPGITDANSEKATTEIGRWQTLKIVHFSPTSMTPTTRALQFVAGSVAAEFYIDSVSIMKAGVELIGNGDMEIDEKWVSVGTPSTQEQIVGANTGSYARRVVATASGQGIEGAAWNMVANRTYAITARVYPVSGIVKMQATGTTAFDKSSNVLAVWQTLRATYTPTAGSSGLKLQFVASGAAAEWYVDSVAITEIGAELAVNGGMEIDSNWTNVGTPTNVRSTTQIDSGSYARQIIASAAQGMEGVAWDWAANRTYLIMARVYPVSGVVKMQVTGTSAFDKTSSGIGSWQTLRSVYTPSTTVTGNKLQFVASVAPAEFYVDSVHIIDVFKLLQWQEFHYDNKGRTLFEAQLNTADGTVLQRTTRTYGTSGNSNGLLDSITQTDQLNPGITTSTLYSYDSAGRVIKTQKTSLFGSCQFSYTVYDELGQVVASVCSLENVTAPTTPAAAKAMYDPANPDKNKVTTYEYDALGRRVKTTTDAGSGTVYTVPGTGFERSSLTFYDGLDRVIRTITNYANQSAGAAESSGLWVWSIANNRWEKSSGNTTAITFGADNNQNAISDTTYNARGMVRSQRDAFGNTTLYGYDDAGRLIKTIQNASQDPYNNDYNTVINPTPDPTLSTYVPSSNPDKDVITTQTYDAAGNLIKVVDPLGSVTYTIYDTLNRPVKTIQAAKDSATLEVGPGEVAYTAAYDPRSEDYEPSLSPDRDLIQTTEYDNLGRVIRSKRLLENRPLKQWETTLYGYDTLGRQVKVIQKASDPNYFVNAVPPDPSLAYYGPNSAVDQDIVTQTAYDPNGRVMYTEDSLGARTWMGYDGWGRQVKTIVNAVGTATNNGINDPRSSSYVPSSAPDKDLVSSTTYNSDGQVQSTQDALNRTAYNVYDTRARVIRTIANYLVQGTTNPKDWVWSTANNRWEDGAGNAISFGSDNDQNRINDSEYDAQGRIFKTVDNRHNLTQVVYDGVGRRLKSVSNYIVQGSTIPDNWVWSTVNSRWEDGAGNAISFGTDKDQNRISLTTYDLLGRVVSTRDAAGLETRFSYDRLGRRLKSVTNYVPQGGSDPANWIWDDIDSRWEDGAGNAINFGTNNEQNLISETLYNKAGQIVTTRDARGTQTAFTYDKAGRRLTATQASSHPLATTSYTIYDKAGRVLRSIANYATLYREVTGEILYKATTTTTVISPDTKTGSTWDFMSPHNGNNNDTNLITEFAYDLASRRVSVTDPVGNSTQTAYFKDGQVDAMTDPESVVSKYRYDGLRRRIRVVQGYVLQGSSDPQNWVWDTNAWKQTVGGTLIVHGVNSTDNDQNIIIDVTYDKGGRVLTQREPLGNVTTYVYDFLDRRKTLIKPITISPPVTQTWRTAYTDLTGGKSRVTMTYPGITGSSSYLVSRDFDRMGRLQKVQYNESGTFVTPDVVMTYDDAGNRAKMSEYFATTLKRETQLTYDKVHRLKQAAFNSDNTDNLGTIDESVAYEYDAGGLRTKLTLPGSLNVVYTYDQRGQLVSLTDWDSHKTQFAYDNVGRHIATERANRLRSRYQFDAAGRLRVLRHTKDFQTLAHFEYRVDKRGNRIQALEALANYGTGTTTIASTDKGLLLSGTWSDVSGYKENTQAASSLKLMFFGNEATLSMGQGPDHSIYDVYINGTLWQSFDGYAAVAAQRDIVVSMDVDGRKLQGEGPHLLEIRNRVEKNKISTGNKVRFKQLTVTRTWTQQTIGYTYDKLSRLKEARYNPGVNAAALDAELNYHFKYVYDRAGNRTQQYYRYTNPPYSNTVNYNYNAANQLLNDQNYNYGYDANGNRDTILPSSTYASWDRANRMVIGPPGNMIYDGQGNRVKQTDGVNATAYLLDMQPGLAQTLAETLNGTAVTRFVHGPHGIHAQKDATNNWEWMLQDGLGSVRVVVDNNGNVLESRQYDPYGGGFGTTGTNQTSYNFTGEQQAGNTELLYLRARYYATNGGAFASLDPFEGTACTPMSLNRYMYVQGNVTNDAVGELINGYNYVGGNPVNLLDPSGMSVQLSQLLSSGTCALNLPDLEKEFWTCEGEHCQEWLDDAYALLRNTSGYYSNGAANLFDLIGRSTSTPINISFTQDLGGGTALRPYRVTVDKGYLADKRCTDTASNCSNFAEHIGVVLHELWHTTQGIHRFSTQGEIDSYIFEGKLRQDFGFSNTSFFQSLYNFGTPGNVTNDVCELCRARTCLMDYAYSIAGASGAYQVYASEPLAYVTIELGNWSPIRSTPPLQTIWPFACYFCPDTSCPA
ncbi:MAG: hypothetical protein H0X30_00070 [Anaerolineae bacterium]|nr:hypothetical protein [Anaerolineae bacterium]